MLDEILVKMEDSVNYDNFGVAMQDAPKLGFTPVSNQKEEEYKVYQKTNVNL